MRKLILVVISLGLIGISSADYYLVDPDGRAYRTEKTERGWKPVNGPPSDPEEPNPQWVDTIYWHDTEWAGWYYPNRDSNTVVLQYFNLDWPCSLVAVGISFYSAGWAEFYVWEGPNPLPATSSELEAHLCSTWVYDDDVSSWVTMPNVLFQGSIGTDDPPDDLVSRTAWIDISPGVDLRTDYVLVGYRILTRTNPDGEPYGGKPWPQSDGWVDPLGYGYHWTPCRSWMFRVQETSPLHLTWTGYGDITGDWEFYYVIEDYPPPRFVRRYDQLLGTYDTGDRLVRAWLYDYGVPAESSGVREAWLFYYLNDDTATLDSTEMVLVEGTVQDGTWEATIPSQLPGTEVTYYFTVFNIQGLMQSTEIEAWSYYIGEGHPGHILFHIGQLVNYGPHDPVAASGCRVDVWDEGERGFADSTVIDYYTTGPGEKGIIWLHWTGSTMIEDTAYLADFLDAGGALLLSQMDIPADFGMADDPNDPYGHWTADPISFPFCYNHLALRSGIDDYEFIDTLETFEVFGTPGDPITNDLGYFLVSPARNWTGIFDTVAAGGSAIIYGPSFEILGYRREGNSKLVHIYFLFHEIGSKDTLFVPDTLVQNLFIRNALAWLGLAVGMEEVNPDLGRPHRYFLSQNTSNPVRGGRTTISYSLPRAGKVSLAVYDIAGRRVKRLAEGMREPGVHEAVWNGDDDFGREVSQGVYFYRLSAGDFASTKKMIWLR